MSKAKGLNPELHSTRGTRYRPPGKVLDRVVEGTVFVRKAGMYLKFRAFNKKGQSDINEWIAQ